MKNKRKELTKAGFETIQVLLKSDLKRKDIATVTGYSQGTVYRVAHAKTWENHIAEKQQLSLTQRQRYLQQTKKTPVKVESNGVKEKAKVAISMHNDLQAIYNQLQINNANTDRLISLIERKRRFF